MKTEPRILFLDVENTPTLGFFYDLWKEGNIVSTEKDWYMLSIAYQWAGEKTVKCLGLVDYPRYLRDKEDDHSLLVDIWKLLDEADIVVAHNGDRFDIRKINARFLKHGMKPPSPYKTVDTLKVAKKYFAMNSNKLDTVANYVGVGGKLPTIGIKLWKACMEGDPKAWALMKKYNKRDVELLVDIYYKLRPWMTNHPHVDIWAEEAACPNCGSSGQKRGFEKLKNGRRKQRYQCKNPLCGAWHTGKPHAVPQLT